MNLTTDLENDIDIIWEHQRITKEQHRVFQAKINLLMAYNNLEISKEERTRLLELLKSRDVETVELTLSLIEVNYGIDI